MAETRQPQARASGLAAGIAGRAAKRPDPKVVAAPVAADQPPPYNPKDDSGPIAPQEGPQTRFLACGADIVMYGGAAGGGKLLATDTPIPTPHGWTTMGALSVGDTVFDERGQPCTVQYLSPVVTDAVAYRLRFSDGTTVTACAEHLWHTYTAAELAASADGAVRTTEKIAATIQTASGRANHAIPVTAALCLPDAPLQVDPYRLGVWWSDSTGSRSGGTITDR